MGRVLVVDDDQYLRDVLSFMLKRLGHEVSVEGSPTAALEVLATERFDVAILDWSMPGMTGGELCERLREDPVAGGMPVMILTAHADEQTRERALASGADRFATKPIKLADLAAAVDGLVGSRT